MKKSTNTIVWVILFLLLFPSSLAVASWDSLPGSRLFSVKLVMEQGLVTIMPTTKARSTLQIAYTERRFTEAKRLIADEASVQGLSYLDNQVNVTRDAILKTKNPVEKKQLAKQYVSTLRSVKTQLEEQKQIVRSTEGPSRATVYQPPEIPTPTRTPTPTPKPTQIPEKTEGIPVVIPTSTPTPKPTPTPFIASVAQTDETPTVVVAQIEQTQEVIQNTIDDIEEEVEQDEQSPNSQGEDHGQGLQGQGPPGQQQENGSDNNNDNGND